MWAVWGMGAIFLFQKMSLVLLKVDFFDVKIKLCNFFLKLKYLYNPHLLLIEKHNLVLWLQPLNLYIDSTYYKLLNWYNSSLHKAVDLGVLWKRNASFLQKKAQQIHLWKRPLPSFTSPRVCLAIHVLSWNFHILPVMYFIVTYVY